MEKLTNDEWMKKLTFHVLVEGDAREASEWCLENLHPREWHHRIPRRNMFIIGGRNPPRLEPEEFAFKEKKHAVMFKLMWWNV